MILTYHIWTILMGSLKKVFGTARLAAILEFTANSWLPPVILYLSEGSELDLTKAITKTTDSANSAELTKLVIANFLDLNNSERESDEVSGMASLLATTLRITQDSWLPPVILEDFEDLYCGGIIGKDMSR